MSTVQNCVIRDNAETLYFVEKYCSTLYPFRYDVRKTDKEELSNKLLQEFIQYYNSIFEKKYLLDFASYTNVENISVVDNIFQNLITITIKYKYQYTRVLSVYITKADRKELTDNIASFETSWVKFRLAISEQITDVSSANIST